MSKAKLELEGTTYELDVIEGTEGEKAIDISKLRATSGYITLDPGFANTGSCLSDITFLDGEKGVLRHRGYTIEDLTSKSSFLATTLLLYNNKLPSESEVESFGKEIFAYTKLPEGVEKIIDSFPVEAHPMGVLSAVTSSLSGFYPEFNVENLSSEQEDKALKLLLGHFLAITSRFYRRTKALSPYQFTSHHSYCGDFLQGLFGGEGYSLDEDVAKALDILFILHADHEQNCSASTVRVIGSGHANIFASIAGGINALWGPLHGGANQAVIEMLDAIKADGGDYNKFLSKAKDKEDPFRLMGFGHRVYKNFDPRARIIKKYCDVVLDKLGIDDPVLDIAKGLEKAALEDEYFQQRKLYPNVDFYSGIIYRALGIPTNMFTVLFAMGRLPGWMSQWREMIHDPRKRISRPRQVYMGENQRSL